MCFSASASFGAGVILSVIGVATIREIKKPFQFLFGIIPFIFALQQTSEGFLWLALQYPEFYYLRPFATYSFLFFAQVVWPALVPVAIFSLEITGKRKVVPIILICIGILVSAYLAVCLFTYFVEGRIIGRHISYWQDYPGAMKMYGAILYIIATIVPPFFSGKKYVWLLGLAIIVSYIITAVFYKGYILSVWCFFASLISISVFLILRNINKEADVDGYIKVSDVL